MTQKGKALIGLAALALIAIGGLLFLKQNPLRRRPAPTQPVAAPIAATPTPAQKPTPTPVASQVAKLNAAQGTPTGFKSNPPREVEQENIVLGTSKIGDNEPDENVKLSVQYDVAGNPKWKPFNGYLQNVTDMTRTAWKRIRKENHLPDETVSIVVALTLTKLGDVEIRYVDTKNSKAEALACAQAVKATTPYKVWTDPMKQALEDSEDFSLIFSSRTLN